MKKQWQLVLTAMMFYTRLPVTVSTPYSPELLNRATRYLPLIGWIVAAFMAGILYLFGVIAPHSISILMSIIVGIWITGAFHEDGFADMCDGFGGGWTKEKILEIMKDSRIGTYGMTGLLLLLALKFLSLQALPLSVAILAVVAAQPLSRFVALTVIYTHRYVRENEDSKAKPVSKGIGVQDLLIAAIWGLLPFIGVVIYLQHYMLLFTLLALLPARWYLVHLMQKWIGGYTGDCLGAVQQVAETVIYLCFCILTWKYT
ncbi:adenosylcobinamide-GDP ribazoletransferase [Chitinophaga nivalis]|uniref:Adenosylcobinamide-GDP ribazoletransferase n=1 Tax=Chitinophaga nivalis TaxID=2991709 RepID=A0ABT3IWC0_9BACT|nr:adenosylcobinamide-GDP ribazoletransferase [Chitinophaga nivalis]MCW3462045.1 adenosylcobinamide-GDP ribazoletransferase [Chitinophaga nivalis]MCW3488263.1 adenosylcobinamide-GDP ribazoletransferase [Chitinophaga nivalis]